MTWRVGGAEIAQRRRVEVEPSDRARRPSGKAPLRLASSSTKTRRWLMVKSHSLKRMSRVGGRDLQLPTMRTSGTRRHRPGGVRACVLPVKLLRALDEAMYPEPEEEPVYYWDEEYEGDPEELTTAQIAFHNAHWAGYRAMKGPRPWRVLPGFLALTGRDTSGYHSKRREDERQDKSWRAVRSDG